MCVFANLNSIAQNGPVLLYSPPMIATLTGSINRLDAGKIVVNVGGVGYDVSVPLNVFDSLQEGQEALLHIATNIREDAFELYGFLDARDKELFQRFISMNGVGPKTALELCAVPKSMLLQAIGTQDASLLTTVKGIGKKTAEKLLLDLKSLAEKSPHIFGSETVAASSGIDQDAVDALRNLGYDSATILQTLATLPDTLSTTEERVTEALRSL